MTVKQLRLQLSRMLTSGHVDEDTKVQIMADSEGNYIYDIASVEPVVGGNAKDEAETFVTLFPDESTNYADFN